MSSIISMLIFGVSVSILVYTYFGYPILLALIAKLKKENPIDKKQISPKISLVISAYNEEASIGNKIENALLLDYPKDKIEIVVVSDASTDNTDKIVKEFKNKSQNVKLYRLLQRGGKIAAYRKVFPFLEGEILVYSDATSLLDRNSLKELINNFNDPSIGCVGGLIAYTNGNNHIAGKGESIYWGYDTKIRKHESRLDSLTSVSGTLYAVRKELYPYDMKEYLADDFIVPIEIKKEGLRTILETKAICQESTVHSTKEELSKRARISLQNMRALIEYPEILNIFKYGFFSMLVISHKLGRLMVPIWLLLIFISSLVLAANSIIFSILFLSQVTFYAFGIIGYFLNKKIQLKTLHTVFYFCLSNLAITLGIIKLFNGKKVITWEPIRT